MPDGVFDKLLGENEETETKPTGTGIENTVPTLKLADWLIPLALGLTALAVRLFVLYANNPQSPGWYDDTFHHWQVAYLSKEIGFGQGFLRLWDFKGMEYFWGLLHPLVLVVLFTLTGPVDILIPRLLTVVCGSAVIVLLFLLLKRYFNLASAIAASVFAILLPVSVYSDAAGLQEPLALLLVLLALYCYPKKSMLVGVLLAMAGMVRAEYWLFGTGLFVASLFAKEKTDQKVLTTIGWFIPTVFYLKYLLDQTGNAIYPIYWNFLASVKGEWFANIPLSPTAQTVQLIMRLVFGAGCLCALVVLIKRPRHYLLFLLGFGNILFLGFMLGFGAYIKGYLPRFWVDRLFAWPYVFLGILLSVFLLYYLPSKLRLKGLIQSAGWIVLLLILGVTQFSWPFILSLARAGQNRLMMEDKFARGVARVTGPYLVADPQAKVLVPDDRPPFTYLLVRKYQIGGNRMIGEMFDPFYYITEDSFANWTKYRSQVLAWFGENNIKVVVVFPGKERYDRLASQEPEIFSLIETINNVKIYEVKPTSVF